MSLMSMMAQWREAMSATLAMIGAIRDRLDWSAVCIQLAPLALYGPGV